jgi:hypothetical protein
MLMLQPCLIELGFSRDGVSPWLKCHLLSVGCRIVARPYLEMLNLHLGFIYRHDYLQSIYLVGDLLIY